MNIFEKRKKNLNFSFQAKGGGSANKTFLYQQTPSIMSREPLMKFLKEKIDSLGTAACPPYHLAVVIGKKWKKKAACKKRRGGWVEIMIVQSLFIFLFLTIVLD